MIECTLTNKFKVVSLHKIKVPETMAFCSEFGGGAAVFQFPFFLFFFLFFSFFLSFSLVFFSWVESNQDLALYVKLSHLLKKEKVENC